MFESIDLAVIEGQATPGDRFYLYTDGLAENAGLYVTSESFAASLLASCRHNAIVPLDSAVVNLVRDMTGEQKPTDDVLLLGVEI